MYLGIDIGTSGIKAIIIDEKGHVCDQSTIPLRVSRPHPLWSEQDPDDWLEAVKDATLALRPEASAQIKAIGLSGQMHGACVLGADDRPLRPAILWNDGRSYNQCTELEAIVPDLRSITGNLAMPGFTAPKLLWLQKNEPHLFAAIKTILLPKDYVRLWLTGEKASDMSDSAGTLWLDTGARSWSEAMLKATGLCLSHMPRLAEGPEITGFLRPELATLLGMPSVPVMAGGGDNAAGALGLGVIKDGDGLLSLGTSGVIFVATNEFRPRPEQAVHAFCHCLPDLWHQMSVHLSAASCASWAAAHMGLGIDEFFQKAEQAGAASGPELFLPYLSGERTPHNDPYIRGAYLNLDHETSAEKMAVAVLEGVAFAHADGLDALRLSGTNPPALRVMGGGARSPFWGTILASVLNLKLIYQKGAEMGPALGAARLALMTSLGKSVGDACPPPKTAYEIDPDEGLRQQLLPKYEEFRRAYKALKTITHTAY